MIWKVTTAIGGIVLAFISVYVLKKEFARFKNKEESNHPWMIIFELLTDTNVGLIGAILFCLSLLLLYAAITMQVP
ncbi:MAG: hypothetical protein A2X86_14825 [Bdellovibrionales bacterium GWA2_49_15]|nr:MAG: hypothetical protein A2X86_14825 [Bdellovibrionales bacterium GWA2_49_15]HAZ13385.1 hypothetical protein [Bdellovibrionales bacterium]